MIARETLKRVVEFMRRAKLGGVASTASPYYGAVTIEATEDFIRFECVGPMGCARVVLPTGLDRTEKPFTAVVPFKWLKDRATDKDESPTFTLAPVPTHEHRWISDGFWAKGLDAAKDQRLDFQDFAPKVRVSRTKLFAGWCDLATSVMLLTSNDATRENLYGLGLTVEADGGLTMVAGDGHRVCVRAASGERVSGERLRESSFTAGKTEMVLATDLGSTVAEPFHGDKLLRGETLTIDVMQNPSKADKEGNIQVAQAWAAMHSAGPDGVRFTLFRRVPDSCPPPYRAIVPKDIAHSFQVETEDLKRAIGRVSKVEGATSLTLEPGGSDFLHVVTTSEEAGGWRGTIQGAGDWCGHPMEFNTKYLTQVLEVWGDAKRVTLGIPVSCWAGPAVPGTEPLCVWAGHGAHDQRNVAIVMPMKL